MLLTITINLIASVGSLFGQRLFPLALHPSLYFNSYSYKTFYLSEPSSSEQYHLSTSQSSITDLLQLLKLSHHSPHLPPSPHLISLLKIVHQFLFKPRLLLILNNFFLLLLPDIIFFFLILLKSDKFYDINLNICLDFPPKNQLLTPLWQPITQMLLVTRSNVAGVRRVGTLTTFLQMLR